MYERKKRITRGLKKYTSLIYIKIRYFTKLKEVQTNPHYIPHIHSSPSNWPSTTL